MVGWGSSEVEHWTFNIHVRSPLLSFRGNIVHDECPTTFGLLLLLSFAFTISNVVSVARWRPHPVLGVVLRCRRRSKSTGTHSQYASWCVVHRSRRVARRCNPTHACCCGMVPRLSGTCLAGSTGHGTIPGSWMVGSLINYLFGHQRFDSATVCARGVGWPVSHPGG